MGLASSGSAAILKEGCPASQPARQAASQQASQAARTLDLTEIVVFLKEKHTFCGRVARGVLEPLPRDRARPQAQESGPMAP